jgi:hypothetical protein
MSQSPARSATAYERLQLHVGPHLHESPQGQLFVLPAALLFWQPHLHDAPTQETHEHELDLVDMVSFPLNSG